MFSSKDLISFVFANENDVYYGSDLIKRDLNQYLWERLHANYEAVYFLSAKDNSFRVSTYGDLRCSEYPSGKKKLFGWLGGGESGELGNWIQKQLRAKSDSTAAFVCPLSDFCEVLSDPKWQSVLQRIAEENQRTGIFVLTASATAEKTTDLLLTSPVFEHLQENAITDLRGGATRELYGTLKKRKWDNCVFLNTFGWEQVQGLLLHLVMEYPDRCSSCEQLDLMTEYLHTCLRDPGFAATKDLFSQTLVGYLRYEEIYNWLSNERNWTKFAHRCDLYIREGKKRSILEPAGASTAVLRDPNTYAGRCLKIHLPKWLREDAEAEAQALLLLQSIQEEVKIPKNRAEHPSIADCAETLLGHLEAVRTGDSESYLWILEAIKSCVGQVYAQPEQPRTEKLLRLLQKRLDAVTVFDQHFLACHNVSIARATFSENKLQNITLKQAEANLYKLHKVKQQYVDLIRSLELELNMSENAQDISLILDDIQSELDHFAQIPQSAPDSLLEQDTLMDIFDENKNPPPKEPEKKKEEMEFDITADMYNYLPPTY